MIWQDWVLILGFVSMAYIAIGVIFTLFVIDQTPYALNPMWIKIFLWPLFLIAMAVG